MGNYIMHYKDGTIKEVNPNFHILSIKNAHRIDGPAYYSKDNVYQQYIVNGKRHRIDGPALIGYEEVVICSYFIDGKPYTKDNFNKYKELVRIIYG
jgi:hypothetical protein